MFIKLTRMDGAPIWINGGFVVTVEPRKGGGSVVVPIGDGLDYDVREAPEAVLSMLSGIAPAPVAVPAPKSLTLTPDDVSPANEPGIEGTSGTGADEAKSGETAKSPTEQGAKNVRKGAKRGAKRAVKEPLPDESAQAPAASGDATSETVPGAAPMPSEPERASATEHAPVTSEPPMDAPDVFAGRGLTDDEVARLRKMAPGSLRKLQNTLVSQFRVDDADGAVTSLIARGVLVLDRDRVVWQVQS